ncbi:ABC transporter, ATP-binding protein [hydrothermal vent metagenome]|uniref:ABC transporter, ATP-binding protein n=1 Tax=hydrothermal vent metagenome TaxID=652676 RepID=A0A3B0ZH69_9ZZZZ
MSSEIIQLKNITKEYYEGQDKHAIFDNLSVNFIQGQTTAIIGRSGSGKSTLLNLIGGIDLPTSGEVIVNGNNITLLDESARTKLRRRDIGFIFQAFNIIPTLTVLENILLPLELNHYDKKTDKAMHLLDQVGLADRHDSFPDRLSGGEQQRIAIARALIHEPEIVLADEPTGNLDAKTADVILQLLKELICDKNHTLLLVTHSMEIAKLADVTYEVLDEQLMLTPC